MAVYRIGGIVEDVAAQVAASMTGAAPLTDPCGKLAALRTQGITASSPIPAFAMMVSQLEQLCAQQRPTLSLRSRPTTTTTSTAPYDPCAVAQRARAAGQAAVIVANLDAKCREFRATSSYAPGGASRGPSPIAAGEPERTGYPEPPPESSISPALIAAGVAAAGVIGFVAWKKLR